MLLADSNPTRTDSLNGMLSQHYAFREVTEVATFLIERSKRPVLRNALSINV